jgi:outer membrane protein
VDDATAAFNTIENRMQNGLASVQNVLSAKANKLQAEYDLKVAQSELERYRADLALSVGMPISSDFQVQTVFNDASMLVEEVETLMEKALQSRSDLLAKEEALHAADWAHLKTEREQWPSVNVTGNINTLKYRHYPHWQNNYTVGINLSWDVFSGFEKQYKELEHYAAMKEKRFELHQLQLKVLSDVWSEFHTFQAVQKSFAVAQALESASRKSYEAIQVGYESGLNNVLELLDAQSKLAQARLQRIRAQSDLCIHWAQLAYVAGQITPPPPTPNADSPF